MSKKFELTPAQRTAVDLRGHTMLVSAAAGSGKTAVLTKRIIKLITDTENPVDISELVVVTYTKATASELREKISSAIYSALTADPTSKHLSNQLLRVGNAKISTIHSFCSNLVRSNFQRLGLPANMRVAEETESSLISNNVFNELIEQCYGGLHTDKIKDFPAFAEHFLQGKKDDGLALMFSNIYRGLRNYYLGIDLLINSAEELEKGVTCGILDTKWGRAVRKHLKRTFSSYYRKLNDACDYFMADDLFFKNYYPSFEADRDACEKIALAADNADYKTLSFLFQKYDVPKKKAIPKDDQTDVSRYFDSVRTKYRKEFDKCSEKYFSFSVDTVKKHFLQTAEVCRDMYAFLCLFDQLYSEEKQKRGLLDFNDLEVYTLRLLYDDKECTKPSELGRVLRESYKYIFIDEYQDVNELQDKIFSGISSSNNRFMVGDIKQSIYGFRGAEPDLFSDYRTRFPECPPDVDSCPDSDGVTLYLSNNFRSDKSVIDFSNAVFEVLFNNNSGKTPYTPGDRLVCSKLSEDGSGEHRVKMCFVEEGDEISGVEAEAEFVADSVQRLINEGTEPSDITLLFRSRTNTLYFEEALKRRNISSFNRVDRDFFENDAVLLMLCLLNTIDNPSRDIYLAGALKSPLFGFTMTDITVIRRAHPKGTLYEALVEYSKNTEDKKVDYFFDCLCRWRSFAEGCPVDKLVRKIYNDTHIVELLSGRKNKDSDIERQANLLLLYDYARQFENGSFKGLYNFILYLNDVLEKKTKLSNARLTGEGKGVVNIMSVHNSKGLEFDTVFFCDTAHMFNKSEERASYILHKEYGLNFVLRDATTFGKFNPLTRAATEIILREEALDEEIRVLYVALTRAKKRLIITSCLKNAQAVIDDIKLCSVDQQALLDAKCMSELILQGILHSDYSYYDIEYIKPASEAVEEVNTESGEPAPACDESLVNKYEGIIKDRFSFEYKYKELTMLPSKLAVSQLYPAVLDEYTTVVEKSAPAMYLKPRFLLPEEQRFTAAERGTATHLFMQFCDFDNAKRNGVNNELQRLLEKGFIDKRNASLVNIAQAESFFDSKLFSELAQAKDIWREHRFNIKLPASDFTQDEERKALFKEESVLVQGVIDLLFVDKTGKLVLADYNTDYFSLSDIESGNAERILVERHKEQLSYYAIACGKMFGRSVDRIEIYSFALGMSVIIK